MNAAHKRAVLLAQAADRIVEAAATLDRSTHDCGECKRHYWNNRAEYQRGVELDAMVLKLRRFAAEDARPRT